MKSALELGAILAQARAAQQLGIDELSRRTGLPERYLEALEQGDHDRLPGRAYARIYYLNYARALGLETDALMLAWPQPEPDGRLERRPARMARPWHYLSAGLLAGLALWFFIARPSDGDRPSARRTAPSQAAPNAVMETMLVRDPIVPAAGPNAAAHGGSASRHVLEVRADLETWILLEADGDTAAARIVPGGQTLSAEASRVFLLTVTRPDAVQVYLDGARVELPDAHTKPLVRHRIAARGQEEG